MSLFPAYSNNPASEERGTQNSPDSNNVAQSSLSSSGNISETWLYNISFKDKDKRNDSTITNAESTLYHIASSSSHKKKKKKKKKSKDVEKSHNYQEARKKDYSDIVESQGNGYVIDKKKLLPIDMTRCSHLKPRFKRLKNVKRLGDKFSKFSHKTEKSKRYFNINLNALPIETADVSSWNHQFKAEVGEKLKELREKVSHEPNDVDSWLELSRCTLTNAILDRVSEDDSVTDTLKSTLIRDQVLPVLDRGLNLNPCSTKLIRERYGLASMKVPADQLISELRKHLKSNPLFIEGWLELARMEKTQLASFSVSRITDVFTMALEAVHANRARESPLFIESLMLNLVLGYGHFLIEAGLTEQVWTLIRLYTETSFSSKTDGEHVQLLHKSIYSYIAKWEDIAGKEEDELLKSCLPSSELWLRIERLRSNAHILPAPECKWARQGDPQRLVFPEDLSSLSFPIIQRGSSMRIISTVALILGAPPVPGTHVAMEVLSPAFLLINQAILAASWPLIIHDLQNSAGWFGDMTKDIQTGYLLNPGRGGKIFRQLLAYLMVKLAGKFTDSESSVLLCWWLRIETLLTRITSDTEAAKFTKSTAKTLLKLPEYRDNISLYAEFALFEATMAKDMAKAENILLPIVQTRLSVREELFTDADSVSIYLILTEIWAAQDRWDKITPLLTSLINPNVTLSSNPNDNVVDSAIETYKQIIFGMLRSQNGHKECDILEILSVDLLSSLVACVAWLIMSRKNVWVAATLIDEILSMVKCNDEPISLLSKQREQIYMIYIKLLEIHTRKNNGGLIFKRKILIQALEEYPNNSVLQSVQSQLPSSIIQDLKLVQEDDLLGSLIKIMTLDHKQSENSEISSRLIAQYKKLTRNFQSKYCPLVWRLYLRHIESRCNVENIKEVLYKALDDCPWVKKLYMKGVALLPEICTDIQNLLVEKDLRLHIVPEELQILAS